MPDSLIEVWEHIPSSIVRREGRLDAEMMPQPVKVLAYSGHRGEEEPRALEIAGVRLGVREILRRWRDPEGRVFEVRDERGERHVLLCRDPELSWWRLPPDR